jgi:hypothetical protein
MKFLEVLFDGNLFARFPPAFFLLVSHWCCIPAFPWNRYENELFIAELVL